MVSLTLTAPNVRALDTARRPRTSPARTGPAAEEVGDSDRALIAAVRRGDPAAFGTLYAAHVAAAYNLARQLSLTNADDLVAEAFIKVLSTLRDNSGRGPDQAFRAYLLAALRHVHYDKFRRDKRVIFSDDVAGVAEATGQVVPFTDTAVNGLERTLAGRAFVALPPRWQAVLWHTVIQQQSPAEVAPLFGLSANAVAQLACRAREGLRRAYLQMHVAEDPADQCQAALARLGAWTRAGLNKRETQRVQDHLDGCAHCRAVAGELRDANAELAC